jgi:hypothetical protein
MYCIGKQEQTEPGLSSVSQRAKGHVDRGSVEVVGFGVIIRVLLQVARLERVRGSR